VLGVLGVPLITVPDSSPRASKVVLVLGGGRAPPPAGVAPEASEEWFDSSEVLMPFVMAWPAWLFPHAT
jgi:hypothetical protein